jgi:carbamoyltransferase
MVRFKDGRMKVDNSWFAFHLGGENVYSKKWIEKFGPACTSEAEVEAGEYKHYAASGQKVLEHVFTDAAQWVKERTGETNLVMAGGVALNSSANGKLRAQKIFDDIWIQPAAYDPGCALGVCYYIWHQKLGKPRSFTMKHAYWGPKYSDGDMRGAAERHGLAYEVRQDIEKESARLLSEGNVIGWYQGRMEWGPRSLGNRSILADPRRAEMKEVVNSKIKFREPYRPFAPSVLEEDVGEYFDWKGKSPYMLFVCPVKKEKQSVIPAVTHVDGSARIQTVSKDTNPRYWNLINEFKNLTGVSAVLNTSFNVKGEPIVCTPEEAVKCFLNTEMDYLVMGNILCSRKS